MKARFKYLVSQFVMLLLLFVVQKPVFMIFNHEQLDGISLHDFFSVVLHGLPLDLAVCAYVSIVPLLLLMASLWMREMRFRRIMAVYYVVISLVLTAIFVGDTVLYSYWKFKLDATIFTFLATPKQAFASASVGMLVCSVLLIALLAAGTTYLFWRVTPKRLVRSCRVKYELPLLLLCGGILFLCIRGGVGTSTNNVGTAYFSGNRFLNHSAVNPAFSLFYTSLKNKDYSKECNFFPENERRQQFAKLYPENKYDKSVLTDTLLNTQRPNILLIIMESFSAKFVESLGGMHDVTPNLVKLGNEGIIFTNCYANSFRTDRGLVSILSGYLGMPNATIMKMSNKCATLPSVASSLANVGYKTQFVYGGDINFTNMSGYMLSTGFSRLVSDKDFSFTERHSNAWGVNDEYTFNRVYDIISENAASDYPTFTAFLTLSSHDPFEVPYKKFDDKIRNGVSYTDYCLGRFIDKLKKSPAWDNLLLICVADHGFCYSHETNSTQPVSFHIPMIFAGGAVVGHKAFDMIMNQSDFPAILLAQMGINHNDFIFSRNVLSDEYDYPFAMYSFIDGFGFVDESGVTVYDNNSESVVYSENQDVSGKRLNSGKTIIQSMYRDLSKR